MNAEDRAFLAALEDCSLDPARFNHVGHVRAAWLCLRCYGLVPGAARFHSALIRYATHLGAAGKYHATITEALLRLIARAMNEAETADFGAFTTAHPALFGDVRSLLLRHYSPERLDSEAARRGFLAPDREPFVELDKV